MPSGIQAGQCRTSVLWEAAPLGNFVSLGNFLSPHFGGVDQASRVTLENAVNPGVDAFASGVGAIRFTMSPDGLFASTIWREFDVEGSATIPEPSTAFLGAIGLGGLLFRRYRNKPIITATRISTSRLLFAASVAMSCAFTVTPVRVHANAPQYSVTVLGNPNGAFTYYSCAFGINLSGEVAGLASQMGNSDEHGGALLALRRHRSGTKSEATGRWGSAPGR